jgi:hypothetical protein
MQYELKQVELMQANVKANGLTFSVDDLMKIATANHALGLSGKIPLKFGHNDAQPLLDGQPAIGWCENLRVVDDKLLGDFVGLPKVVYDAFKMGRYKTVSVELLKNVQAGTRIIPWVVDACALLGADQPAFGNLKDLQSLTMARGAAPKHESRATFTMQTADQVRAEYEVKLNRLKVDGVIEVAIASEKVAPAAREHFRNVFKGEAYTVENWQAFARTQSKPHLRPKQMSHDGTTNDDGTVPNAESAAEQLNRLCAAEVEAVRVKFGRVVQPIDVASVVWRRNPELVRRWHEEQNN